MSRLMTGPLRRLTGAMADLRARVREALAGEMARAVGEAVREVVAAALGGGPPDEDARPTRHRRPPRDRWDDPDPDPWDDHPHGRHDEIDRRPAPDPDEFEPTPANTTVTPDLVYRPSSAPAAVAAGVSAGRWWLRRRGSVLEAVGVGVLAALAVLAGGPVVRAGAAVAGTAADLTAVTDALGAGTVRLTDF